MNYIVFTKLNVAELWIGTEIRTLNSHWLCHVMLTFVSTSRTCELGTGESYCRRVAGTEACVID